MESRYGRIKYLLDIVGAIILSFLLAPAMLLIAVAIRTTMGPPVLFRQQRPGVRGLSFEILKFRTMTDSKSPEGILLPDSERLTRLGRFLRSTSLDELPELLNVLRGEMSFVGPRPLLVQYLDRYSAEQRRRHNVRPGITGLAQVNGRQEMPFSKRLELDVWYVDHCSFLLDLKILVLTIPRVVFSRGVVNGQDVTQVDDVGLHPDSPAYTRTSAKEPNGA